MPPIPHQMFLELGTSLQFLASLFKHYRENQAASIRGLGQWKEKYDVNPLAGPNLAAMGWMIVVRWFELVKVRNSEFPSDLLGEMHRRSGVGKFDMQTQAAIEKNYSCSIQKLDMDSRDNHIFLGSLIRHLRNAISHYDVHSEKRAAQHIVVIQHSFRNQCKLRMELDLINYLKLIGDLGILFQECAVHLDPSLKALVKSGPGITP
ncbi:MAG: hypothetical protein RI601_12490 [Desulfurivibrionaceae bacterium]|nr:hypothetical protein [Desulfurivibrionaceae bacterium]